VLAVGGEFCVSVIAGLGAWSQTAVAKGSELRWSGVGLSMIDFCLSS
jgi:hypothetical protein